MWFTSSKNLPNDDIEKFRKNGEELFVDPNTEELKALGKSDKPGVGTSQNPDKEVEEKVGEENERERGKKHQLVKPVLIGFLLAMIVGGLTAGGILVSGKALEQNRISRQQSAEQKKVESQNLNLPEATESALLGAQEVEATASGEVAVDLTQISVQVLNGSGKSGEAGKVKELLIAEGFKSIEVGNADKSNYTGVEVSHKEEVAKSVMDVIEKALGGDYEATESGELLTQESKYDIVVVVGKGK